MSKIIIRRGSRNRQKIKPNQCIVNALYNHYILKQKFPHKVNGEVQVQVGSMGFKSTDGRIHWEYGDPEWKAHKQFKSLGGAYDAHVWVTYEDINGDTVIVDPWFDWYDTVCMIQGIHPDDGINCRVYAPLKYQGRAHTKIFEEMLIKGILLRAITENEVLEWSK